MICFVLTGGGVEEEVEGEDVTLEAVLGDGGHVLVHVVEERRVHKLPFPKELVGHAIFLLHETVTLAAVRSIVNGEDGLVGALALLHVEWGPLYEQGRMQ